MPVKQRTSHKAIAFGVQQFSSWLALYAWGWLAALLTIACGMFIIWYVPNLPLADPLEPIPADAWGSD